MRSRKIARAIVGAAVLFGATAVRADVAWKGEERSAIRAKRMAGGGGWKGGRGGDRSRQRWQLDVQRADDGSLSGEVVLSGSPLARKANLMGKIEGRLVSGTLADERGQLVASFRGTISDRGISGEYTDRSGEVGDWSWEGTLPQ